MSRFHIVTLSTPEIADYALASEENKRRYAAKHGYGFTAYRAKLDESHPPHWSKLIAVSGAMQTGAEWVFWMDADSIVTNPTKNLDLFANTNADLVIARDRNGINTGIFLIRSCEQSHEFLRRCYHKEYFVRTLHEEQNAVQEALANGEFLGRVNEVHPRAFNSVLDEPLEEKWQPNDFVLHLPGKTEEVRRREIHRRVWYAN